MQILGFSKLEQNRIILSLSVQKNVFFENVDLCGEVPEGVGRYAHLRTRSKFDKNITMYQVWTKSDTPFDN